MYSIKDYNKYCKIIYFFTMVSLKSVMDHLKTVNVTPKGWDVARLNLHECVRKFFKI